MVENVAGNLLEAEVEAFVNTVNTVGVMGKGIALQFRQAFPERYFKEYQKACRQNELQPGKMHVFVNDKLLTPRFIINFPTKKHWRGKSRIEDVETGLKDLIQIVKRYKIESIAIPPLGCGNGGLNWNAVRPLIEAAFADLPDVRVLLFAPVGAPRAEKMRVATKRPKMTEVRAALLSLFEAYLLPGYRLSKLEAQKLAYLLQASGEPLDLRFVKDKFGPNAENLNHLLIRIDGHFIRGYGDRTQKAVEPTIGLAEDALEEAENYLKEKSPKTIANLQNVVMLIEGFEYPNGMELLSTVHWVAVEEDAAAKTDVSKAIELVHSWNSRKKEVFKPKDVKVAWQRLKDCGWLS